MAKKFKNGDTFHLLKGPMPAYKCHVVATVDGTMVVYKWYGRHKQWWHYQVEHEDVLEIQAERYKEYIKEWKEKHGKSTKRT